MNPTAFMGVALSFFNAHSLLAGPPVAQEAATRSGPWDLEFISLTQTILRYEKIS